MVKKTYNDWEKVFSIGYACACANIVRTHDEETIAKDCFYQNFMSIKTMREIGVDEDDIMVLTPIVKSIIKTRRSKWIAKISNNTGKIRKHGGQNVCLFDNLR